jgi:hypothetical protein
MNQGIMNEPSPKFFLLSGESAMQGGNGAEDPLRTVVVNFKGAVQCLGQKE